jgi:phosphatidylglycerophosphate synthase
MPILVSILMPIQKETTRYQSPKTWDWTLYLVLWLVGALMKGFVRPTEDPLNPYSDQMPNIITSFIYFLWFFMVAIFIYMLTARTDGSIPFFDNVAFPAISYWIVFIPYFCCFVMLFITFSVKAFIEWRLVIKQKDPNGDGYFKAINYSAVLFFLLLMFITGILICVKLELPLVRQRDMNMGVALVLIPVASLVMLCLSIFPFVDYAKKVVDKKRRDVKDKIKEQATSPTSGDNQVQPVDEQNQDQEMNEVTPEEGADDEQKPRRNRDDDDDDDSDGSSSTESAEQVRDAGSVEMLTFL